MKANNVEKATPVPMSESESMYCNMIHDISLPTIAEIYKEVGLQALKYALGIVLFLAGWWLLSIILDEVTMVIGY